MKNKTSCLLKPLFSTLLMLISIFSAQTTLYAVCTLNSNLIVNGEAEADPTAPANGGDNVDVSNWESETDGFTIVRYGIGGGFPSTTDPGPASRGTFFFSGGSSGNNVESATQIINIADCATDIDASNLIFSLDGFLGGFSSQADNAKLTATFKNAANVSIGTSTIGPVTPTERNSITGMLARNAVGRMPVGTRTIELLLQMTGSGYVDGYADNLSFSMSFSPTAAPASINGRVSTPSGRGIRNVSLTLTDTTTGELKYSRTSTFGYYRFLDLEVGRSYVLNLSSKRFTFAEPTRVITLNEDLTNEDFVSEEK